VRFTHEHLFYKKHITHHKPSN